MRILFIFLVTFAFPVQLDAQDSLKYVPAPVDNPLKGLVPYARPHPNRFPHSMEFSYLPLSDLMKGPNEFDWTPLENLLDDIASRRHQTVFRVWLEYPGREDGIPPFLESAGVKVTEWLNTNTAPFPEKPTRSPDYSDPRLRAALQLFISELGKRYDGDPRIGFITAGLLGSWGEWHTYPRSELMADKTVQAEVMEAYEQAFKTTPVLLRYPAGEETWAYAANHTRRLGYHDDSFAWATLDTGRDEDDWFFVPSLTSAGSEAFDKWKSCPIGGEIRPELWGDIFDNKPSHEQAQDFAKCVQQTHVSWLMDTGMFRKQQSDSRVENATREVQRMGYEFHIVSAKHQRTEAGGTAIEIRVRNTGVAPFYFPWTVQLAEVKDGIVERTIDVDWSIVKLLPGEAPRRWSVEVPTAPERQLAERQFTRYAIRIVNPLPNGMPLRFANEYSEDCPADWWLLPAE